MKVPEPKTTKRDRSRHPRIWDTDWLIHRKLARLLLDQIKNHVPPGSVMVDLGCGTMPYRAAINELGIIYVGADIEGSPDLRIDSNGRMSFESASANAVLSVQVLEHVRSLDAYCAEIRRLLCDDGTLLLSTHGSWLYHPHPEDHRRWTRTGLATDLEARGLVVRDIRAIVGPLATTTIFRSTGFAVFARKLPVLGDIFASAIAVIMNVRAYLEDAITPAGITMDNACIYLVQAGKAAA
ncbi:MAG TPA: methyltransferase domain-containing protein [Rhizomicrobium sp.]|nr:methyltransferase domain-containing protein [Rhizomicrobium sp.]